MGIVFKTPVGRLVGGSLYNFDTTDKLGKPLVDKNNLPRQAFWFAIAIAKDPAHPHWATTEWGQKIWNEGAPKWPQQAQVAGQMNWKIKDGDGTERTEKNVLYSSYEGYAGHWVLTFSSGWAPKCCQDNGNVQCTEPGMIMPGDYIEVFGNVEAKSDAPGVYLNFSVVNLVQRSVRIATSGGVDPTACGFGGQVPANAIPAPVNTGFNPAAMPVPGVPAQQPMGIPQVAPLPSQPVGAVQHLAPIPQAMPTPIQPVPAIMQPQGQPAPQYAPVPGQPVPQAMPVPGQPVPQAMPVPGQPAQQYAPQAMPGLPPIPGQ